MHKNLSVAEWGVSYRCHLNPHRTVVGFSLLLSSSGTQSGENVTSLAATSEPHSLDCLASHP